MADTFAVHLGALAKPLLEQLSAVPHQLRAETILHWQKDADAITRCAVQGFITSATAERARRKLVQRIAKGLSNG